tara:strand:- start:3764 stop:4624 length:861 start_codon:yes stop_codon:yes gene_type:complete
MPRSVKKEVIKAKALLQEADALLIVTGAGMSVDSGIPTYRGNNGIWTKSIKIGDELYAYDDISSLKMWKTRPELAWGFKAYFYRMMNELDPHQGYYELLEKIKDKFNYFITTSNIDGYFKRAGFDTNRIYEVHGSVNYLQCMDKNCNIMNGVSEAINLPTFNEETFIADWLPKCPNCNKMSRPNVSMFGDVEFYGKPYEHQRKRLDNWLANINKSNKKLLILEIGCGINPHSLRMSNGRMMSGEWKMPKFDNNIGTIRLNPNDEQDDKDTIHIPLGAKAGIHNLFN